MIKLLGVDCGGNFGASCLCRNQPKGCTGFTSVVFSGAEDSSVYVATMTCPSALSTTVAAAISGGERGGGVRENVWS